MRRCSSTPTRQDTPPTPPAWLTWTGPSSSTSSRGRSRRVLGHWLETRPAAWLAQIRIAAIDPFRGYANALRAHLGAATLVVDHFHAVRLANAAIDDVRRRVQQTTLGHRGRRGDPLYGIRRLLVVRAERLSERGWARVHAGLAAGDPEDEVATALLAKELLRDVYSAGNVRRARVALGRFYRHCAEAQVPELTRLANRSEPGRRRSSPTTRPASRRMARPRPSICSSSRADGSASAFATSTTTGSVCFSPVGSTARLHQPHESEAVNHALSRRARQPRSVA